MRLNPFRQADFLYFYSLQAGVVICSSIGIFLAITSMTVNLASENAEIENNIIVGQYILVSFYCIISCVGFLLGLVSAYQEKFSIIYVSICLQSLMLLYWLVLLVLSFYNHPYFTRRICIEYRCADHLWMQDARWRYYVSICDPEDRNLPVIYHTTVPGTDKFLNALDETDISPQMGLLQSDDIGIMPGVSEKVWSPQSDFGKGGLLAVSIIFSLLLFGHYILIVVFGVFSLLGHTLGLMSAYKESKTLALAAAIVQSFMFLYWLTFLIVSYMNIKGITRRICIDNRCPDHLWIQDSRWRPFSGVCDPADLTLPRLSKRGQEASLIFKESNNSDLILGYDLAMNKTKTKNGHLTRSPSIVKFVAVQERIWVPQTGLGKVAYITGSIILSILTGFYFVYAITTLISYNKELKLLEKIEK